MSAVQILQCPACKEYIASDAKSCRFCKRPLDAQTVQHAVQEQAKENKSYRKRQYFKHLLIGAAMFIGGAIITVGTYMLAALSEGGGHFVITYGLMFAGLIDVLYGIAGWVQELRSRD